MGGGGEGGGQFRCEIQFQERICEGGGGIYIKVVAGRIFDSGEEQRWGNRGNGKAK